MTLTTVSLAPSRRSEAPPRWATRRRLDRPTLGGRVGAVAELLGTPLMPWQQLVADVGLELDTDGLPAYREIVVTVMRQSGKSTIVLSLETERCTAWDTPQRVAYTAQTGWDARRKLIDDHAPVLMNSPLSKAVSRVLRGAGNEGILFKSGSRIDVMASNSSAGHGRTLDLGVIDESWDDEDDRREQSILPAMATRPAAQLLNVSTAGTSKSIYLRRKVEAGRHAATHDPGRGIAYFEWSVPDDADIDDPETWWAYMPALGWTITEGAVAHARQSMSDSEFRRGFCNQWTDAEHDRIIPAGLWASVCDENAVPVEPLTFALETLPDRSASAITVGGGGVVELIDHRRGTSWMPGAAGVLQRKYGARVVIDGGGPASSLVPDLVDEGVEVEELSNPEVVAACARIYDAIADGQIRVRTSKPMDEAVEGLAKRPVGDRWVWSRTTSLNDVTPFMAASLAYSPPVAEQELRPFAAFA